ncbi:hypothetical protein MtrunA17_Chr1g0177071 [Medicago truncatula]|uniref:Uncharacterized protein n=1 Tax=Medicago truncatula TaxID=3880 RepID=A0A396JRL8_MEDTR|nr:hypothetical protein MtrunA17_Chr1g0177071 [Medicago truncatula]
MVVVDPPFLLHHWFFLLRRRTHSPCHRRPAFYDMGCGSASNRRRCPCFVDVWRRSDAVTMVVMRGGEALVVEFI